MKASGEKREVVSRTAILELSARLFARHGYRATNLGRVAEQLNVTRQALYYHFPTKGHILAALFDEVMSKMEAAVDSASGDGDGSRFTSMLRAHISIVVDQTDLVALLLHERPEMSKLDQIDAPARRAAYNARFVSAYTAGVDAGELRPLEPRLTVNLLLASANAITAWFHVGSPLKPSDVAKHAERLLVDAVLNPVPAQPDGSR